MTALAPGAALVTSLASGALATAGALIAWPAKRKKVAAARIVLQTMLKVVLKGEGAESLRFFGWEI